MAVNPKLGTALAFTLQENLQINSRGRYRVQDGPENVRQAVWLRIHTPLGALVLHPEYGNPVYDLLSEPMDETWPTRAALAMRECLSYEPRIEVQAVQIKLSHEERKVQFVITYIVLGQPKPENVVWEGSYEPAGV
ncbi:GPW/gp25 family protein [Desulforamulus ruminis]|nr:GPW/gp25 family protein [Desulforamulus ruminis]